MVIASDIIKEMCVTEKASMLSTNTNQYVFEVFPKTNKNQIAKAIEQLFSVNVEKVNTLIRKGKIKRGRTSRGASGKTNLKKIAVVTLSQGEKIEIL